MFIDLIYDGQALAAPQSFRNGMQTAADLLQAAFDDNITINIAVGYGEFPAFNGQPSQPLPNQNTSEGEAWGNSLSYATLRQDLVNTISSLDDNTSVASLPNTSSLEGHSSFFVANAQLNAFGTTTSGAADGGVGMGTNFTGNVLISGALHEITHAMGRIAGSSLDVFRFNEDHSGNHVFGGAIPATPAYFSINGGGTNLADFGISSDPGDFLNPPNSNRTPNDPFNESVDNLASLTAVDITIMDILGFHQSIDSGFASGSGFASPTFELSAFGVDAGGWSSNNTYPRELAGDAIFGFSSAGVYESRGTGGGHFAAPTFELAAFGASSEAGGWSSNDTYPREVANVTGFGGRADIVGFGAAGVYVSPGTRDDHFQAPTFELAAFGVDAGGWSSDNIYPRRLADVNGPPGLEQPIGTADIVGFGAAGVYVSLSGGGGFGQPTFALAAFGVDAGGWSSEDLYPRELADVNGDQKADIVGFGADGVYVSLAGTGGGAFGPPTFELAAFGVNAGGWSSDDLYPRGLADVNGDGRADIVGFGADGVYVALATGGGHFASPTFQLSDFGTNAGGWSSNDTYPREMNGSTIVGFAANGVWTSTS
jgi:hypothetical protein